MQNNTTVVLGFSCVGKSTFIKHLVSNIDEYKAARPVYEFMFRNGEVKSLAAGDLFHMDMSATSVSTCLDILPCVRSHPLLERTLEGGAVGKVIVLIAPEVLIRERISKRRLVGIGFGRDSSQSAYPVESKLRVLSELPLADRYDQWFDYLEQSRIRFEIVRTDCAYYESVISRAEARKIIVEVRSL